MEMEDMLNREAPSLRCRGELGERDEAFKNLSPTMRKVLFPSDGEDQ